MTHNNGHNKDPVSHNACIFEIFLGVFQGKIKNITPKWKTNPKNHNEKHVRRNKLHFNFRQNQRSCPCKLMLNDVK